MVEISGELLVTAVLAGGSILISWGVAKKTVSDTEEKVKKHDEVLPEIGKLQIQLTAMDTRVAEDRRINQEQHEKFLESKYLSETTAREMSEVKADVKEIKSTTQTILIEIGKLSTHGGKDVPQTN